MSVELPPEPPEPTVHRLVQVIGTPGPGVAIVPESSRRYWGRLGVHVLGSFTVLLALSLALLAIGPTIFGYRPVVVASGSMAPALRVSDVVVVRPPPDQLVEGAIIDYGVGESNRIHRIVEVTDAGYRTKGDANASPDPGLVDFEDIDGVGVMVVPYVGAIRLWLDDGRWLPLVVVVAVLIAAGWVTPRRWLSRPRSVGVPVAPR